MCFYVICLRCQNSFSFPQRPFFSKCFLTLITVDLDSGRKIIPTQNMIYFHRGQLCVLCLHGKIPQESFLSKMCCIFSHQGLPFISSKFSYLVHKTHNTPMLLYWIEIWWHCHVQKPSRKISPTPLHHSYPGLFLLGAIDPCFHVVYTEFWLYYPNVAAEIETH